MKTGRESDQFQLRMPDGMRDRLEKWADLSGRSMNAEAVLAIQEYLDKAPVPQPVPPVLASMAESLKRIADVLQGTETTSGIVEHLADALAVRR